MMVGQEGGFGLVEWFGEQQVVAVDVLANCLVDAVREKLEVVAFLYLQHVD